MKFNASIFREYDIRGIAGSDLDEAFASRLATAFSSIVREEPFVSGRERPRVVVGRDVRLTSDSYAEALIESLLKGGLDVVDIGTCPTPLAYFALFHLDLDACLMVTASHNPSEYNGFKLCLGKNSFYGASLQELLKRMESGNPYSASASGVRSRFDVIPAYIKRVISDVKPKRKLKVVLDAGNATAGSVAPALFEALGASVVPLFCEIDGRFPNHHPDPTVEENLRDLKAAVIREKADFGAAFDGDSDRIGVVDEQGRVIFGDMLLIILARAVLKEKPGAPILSEVKSSHRLYADIAAHGGKPIMWKTGHSLIKTKMKETKAALAGEMSGHVFFADRYYGFDDAIYTAARLYEIVAGGEKPLSRLLDGVPVAVATPELRVDCEDSKKFELVEVTKKNLREISGLSLNDLDGVRVDFSDGWGLVRASNTQPALVLRFEAETQARLDEIRRLIQTALVRAAESIGHPRLHLD